MAYLFKFFLIFSKKTDGQTLDTETQELSFFLGRREYITSHIGALCVPFDSI